MKFELSVVQPGHIIILIQHNLHTAATEVVAIHGDAAIVERLLDCISMGTAVEADIGIIYGQCRGAHGGADRHTEMMLQDEAISRF